MLDNPTLLDLDALTIPLFRRNRKARLRLKVKLSPQEFRVMQMKADGMTTEAIAQKLGIAIGTTRRYIESVHSKLNVQSTECAVAKLTELRIISANVGEYIEEER